jgi:ribonuclease G
VLHALEAQTGKSFLFEGSEGLTLDHVAITFAGTREEVEERALPFRQGDEVLVEIVEPHMYDVDDAVAKIDGYIISIAGAAVHVGEKRMVRIDQVGRTAASALLLDESGEVLTPVPRPPAPAKRRPRKRPAQPKPAGDQPASKPVKAQAPEPAQATDAEPSEPAEAGEDGVQSKPRRRGRRGGRRRSAAKAKAGAAEAGTES